MTLSETSAIEPSAAFPPASREDWLTLVERTLKGAPLESLTSRTLERLPIQPLYEPAARPPLPARLTRGWDVRAIVRHPHPASANAEAVQDLAGGASSLLLRIDPRSQAGVAVASAEALADVLEGVLLDLAPVALDAGFLGAKAADWLAAAAKGAPAAPLLFHMDPVSAFAQAGASPGPMAAHLIACANVGARLTAPYPKAGLFLASGRAAHEAGGGEALELALAMASALAYAKALTRAGLPTLAAFERIVLGLAVDADYFVGVAKLRAARLVWAKLTAACGAEVPARIEARSSARMLTAADPWTNMIRLTAAGAAAAVGGADAVALGAFTDALGLPTPFARRQARNAQLVLMDEANLGRVIDPAAGSGYVEALTDELARAAWERLQMIEAAGGVIAALEGAFIASQAHEARTELARRIESRELRVLGVTDFRTDDARPVDLAEAGDIPAGEAPSPRLPGPDSRCPPLTPIRLETLS
ncbi:MAG: methylmalonyl-CoA mutase family protein [Caulobacterales bacterium]